MKLSSILFKTMILAYLKCTFNSSRSFLPNLFLSSFFFLRKTGESGGGGLCLQFLIWVLSFSDGTDLKNTKSICGGIQRFLGGKGLFIVLSFHHFTQTLLNVHVITFLLMLFTFGWHTVWKIWKIFKWKSTNSKKRKRVPI